MPTNFNRDSAPVPLESGADILFTGSKGEYGSDLPMEIEKPKQGPGSEFYEVTKDAFLTVLELERQQNSPYNIAARSSAGVINMREAEQYVEPLPEAA